MQIHWPQVYCLREITAVQFFQIRGKHVESMQVRKSGEHLFGHIFHSRRQSHFLDNTRVGIFHKEIKIILRWIGRRQFVYIAVMFTCFTAGDFVFTGDVDVSKTTAQQTERG